MISKSTKYPRFSQVIQSWHTPMLLDSKVDDAGYSACVTLGVASSEAAKKILFVGSLVNGKITDVLKLKKHILCLYNDYLNKTDELKPSPRTADIVIFESKYKEVNPILDSLKNIEIDRFVPEFNGGADLERRVNLIMPYIERLRLMNHPIEPHLREDDRELMSILSAYPSPESYAVTSAFTQAILYLVNSGAFEAPRPYVPKREANFY